jgi:hypothetical protein
MMKKTIEELEVEAEISKNIVYGSLMLLGIAVAIVGSFGLIVL